MTSPTDAFLRAHQCWQQQNSWHCTVDETQVLRKRPGAEVSFEALCSTLLRVVDLVRNRASRERQPQDAHGNRGYGDGFALVNADHVGLFVRVR